MKPVRAFRNPVSPSNRIVSGLLSFSWRGDRRSPTTGDCRVRWRGAQAGDGMASASRMAGPLLSSRQAGGIKILKETVLWLSCGACGREARECGQRGGRGASLVHGLSTRPAGRGLARRARPQLHRTLPDRCRAERQGRRSLSLCRRSTATARCACAGTRP